MQRQEKIKKKNLRRMKEIIKLKKSIKSIKQRKSKKKKILQQKPKFWDGNKKRKGREATSEMGKINTCKRNKKKKIIKWKAL